MSDTPPNKIIETLVYICGSVRSTKDKIKYCEKQIAKEEAASGMVDVVRMSALQEKKEALIAELTAAYEKRSTTRVELNELFASLRG